MCCIVMGQTTKNQLQTKREGLTSSISKAGSTTYISTTKSKRTHQTNNPQLGVSNIPVPMLEEWLPIASTNNYIKPSVYQGQYNLLCRGYETTLVSLLRQHLIHFTAYSPPASGFLLGNFTEDGVQGGSRFSKASPYLKWYDKPSMHEAIKRMKRIAEEAGVDIDQLSLRWVVHHSVLGGK